jgi:predicted secreted protein
MGVTVAILTGAALGAGGAMLELTEQDCGRERDVAAGEMIRLVLPEPGGTGYLWEPRHPDPARLQLLESTTARRGEKQLLGGTHDRIFLFRATAPGKVRLTLELRRPWEQEEPAAKSCTLLLNIK